MSDSAPFRPHHTGAELIVRLGPTAEVSVTVDDDWPIIEIAWGSIQLLLMPNTAAMGAPIMPCDIDRARDLHRAAGVYLAALETRLAAQEANAGAAMTADRRPDLPSDMPARAHLQTADLAGRNSRARRTEAPAPGDAQQLDGPGGPINLGRNKIHGARGMAGPRPDGSNAAPMVPDRNQPDRHSRPAA